MTAGRQAHTRTRSHARLPPPPLPPPTLHPHPHPQGLPSEVQAEKVRKAIKVYQGKKFRGVQKGEADRMVEAAKPKHLFTGKSGIGKRDWR